MQLCLKRDCGTGVFLWMLQNFSEHLFYKTPPGDCFCNHGKEGNETISGQCSVSITPKNAKNPDVFGRYRKRTLAWNGLT